NERNRVIAAAPISPPKSRTKCMNPENVAAFAALVKAPASSASKTMLATRPMYVHANPAARTSSTMLKLVPAQELSAWAQNQHAAATIVSPNVKISRELL